MAANILVVEDEAHNRQLMCKSLRAQGYEIAAAKDGVQAVELLAMHTFQLVISDLVLPNMHGLSLVDLIHSKWPNLPIIVISGYLSEQAGRVILDGVAEFIQKPFEPAMLVGTVQRLLLRDRTLQ